MIWLKSYQINIDTTSSLDAKTSLFFSDPRKLQSSCATRTESVLIILGKASTWNRPTPHWFHAQSPHMIELKINASETRAGMHFILYKHLKSYFQSELMPLLYAQISAYSVNETTLVRDDSTLPFKLSVVSLCFVQGWFTNSKPNMADWLRFHFVIARRRYTGSSAPADSADCRFGDMARGREGRREGGGEGRGLSTLSTNQNLCDHGA